MIDEYNDDRTGWARFGDELGLDGEPVMRYRLARVLRGPSVAEMLSRLMPGEYVGSRCVFVMLNPSTANAFKHDPTVGECIKRARALGSDVLEVVNLFALRSPYPADLKKRAYGSRGDDEVNNEAILSACTGAEFVIAAWGNHGELDHRAAVVQRLLTSRGIKLHHLGTTQEGHPKHPLARGKHRIPADLQLTEWTA